MRTALCLLALAAACGPDRGPVAVTAFHDFFGAAQPMVGATIVFADRDGDARVAYVDDAGHADGEVEPGGSVWLAWYVREQLGTNILAAYDDVEPGAIAFGAPPPDPHAVTAHMTFTGSPPAGDEVRAYAACAHADGGVATLAFDDRCTGTADVLVVAIDLDRAGDRLTHYAWLPAQPIADGATITVDAAAWRPVDQVALHVTLPAGAPLAGNSYLRLSNGLVDAFTFARDGDTFRFDLPLVGDHLRVSGELIRDVTTAPQHVELRLPLLATQDVALAATLAPWTIRDPASNTWHTDDAGGALTADAMLVGYRWDQPIANFVETNDLRVLSPPRPLPASSIPRLPSPLARHQPGDDFRVLAVPHLVRAPGLDAPAAERRAEQLTRRPTGSIPVGELPLASFAITLGD